jgi:hypothetical protein
MTDIDCVEHLLVLVTVVLSVVEITEEKYLYCFCFKQDLVSKLTSGG